MGVTYTLPRLSVNVYVATIQAVNAIGMSSRPRAHRAKVEESIG